MVSAPLSGALSGATREGAVAFIVSYEGLAERGLGSLPGGDESELVKGVRAWSNVEWPRRDIVEGIGVEVEMETAHTGVDVLQSMQSVACLSAAHRCEVNIRCCPSCPARFTCRKSLWQHLRGFKLTDEPARCGTARRDGGSILMPRPSLTR
jgi:hypothetical protein